MPLAPNFTGTPTIQTLDAVFAVEIAAQGRTFFLSFRMDSTISHGGRRRRIIRAAGLQIFHDLGAAVACSLHEPIDGRLVGQLRQRNARTLVNRTSGTMVSPCPPSTIAVTFSNETFSSSAINVRNGRYRARPPCR